jgi:hypothetical protein
MRTSSYTGDDLNEEHSSVNGEHSPQHAPIVAIVQVIFVCVRTAIRAHPALCPSA